MKFQHTLGTKEKIELVFERNCLTGSFVYRENGEEHRLRSPWELTTHFQWKLAREYNFKVGEAEKYSLKVIHSRPRWFGGLRPQTFALFADGKLLETYVGY